MHIAAEFGGAAHWNYKLQGTIDTDTNNSFGKALPSADFITKSRNNLSSSPANSAIDVEALSLSQSDTTLLQTQNNDGKSSINQYIEALKIARTDLVQQSSFIFISPISKRLDGKIIPLPAGSTVLDTLRECEVRYNLQILSKFEGNGNEEWMITNDVQFNSETVNNEDKSKQYVSLWLNGMGTNMNELLANGDVLTVPI